MKEILFGLTLIACAAGAAAANEPSLGGVHCISFAPAGFCDGMEYDSAKSATWHSYDCGGSQGLQTRALYPILTITRCDGAKGCNPAAAYGWDKLSWKFDLKASTGTLTGVMGGQKEVIQQDIPVDITKGACNFSNSQNGISSLSR